MDTSSRTSVALSTVLMRRVYGVTVEALPMAPDLDVMLARADAALIIGDAALFLDQSAILDPQSAILKIDLGELWTQSTGLPFVYAVWAGWPGAMQPDDVGLLRRARDEGVAQSDEVARAYYPDDPGRQAVAKRYLRDNIQYYLGDEELEGLRTFYRYAAEEGLVPTAGSLRFF
jgi:chorismate dehydratase